jgi:hypothetical protein
MRFSVNDKWSTFVGEYKHDGRTFCLNIIARDENDAVSRAQSIGESWRALGELGGTIEVSDEEADRLKEMLCGQAALPSELPPN